MIVVKDTLVSDDIADRCFACDLCRCKGACCVEGDSGAPLEADEVAVLQTILPKVRPYMSAQGIEAVERQGVAVRDVEGDLGTPLIDGGECAFVCHADDGTALCAIERAYRDGKVEYMKPVSCHLYPIRVENYGHFIAVNYHKWNICRCAVEKGTAEGVPLYRYLREPLQRRFGKDWYAELVRQIESK